MSALIHAKLRITVHELDLETHQFRRPHLHLRLGHVVYTTPKKTENFTIWNDSFDFDVTFHQHLFWTVQIDVFDSRFFAGHQHMGRAEVRLNTFDHPNNSPGEPRWVDLREKRHCYANLTILTLPDRELHEHIIGRIKLSFQFKTRCDQENVRALNLPRNPFFVNQLRYNRRANSLPDLGSVNYQNISIDDEKNEVESLAIPSFDNENYRFSRSGVFSDDGTDIDDNLDERHIFPQDDLQEAKRILGSSREMHSFAKKFSGLFFKEEDHEVIKNLFNTLAGFGQGIEVGGVSLTVAFLILRRFYEKVSIPFDNNLVLTKADIEVPRILYRYAYAAHGWPALFWFGKRTQIISDVVGSNSNYRAVLDFLKMDPNDMLICDLDQHRLYRPNFFVALDRRLSAVILSIRGTMSFRDTLTDLSLDYMPWKGGIVHSGMLASATWFLENVGRQLCIFAEEYKMSRIIITGFSLGSATSALLTIMLTEELERTNQWPLDCDGNRIDIHCYGYGTPAVMSPDLAARYTNLIDSFIAGNDIIPRLSYGTLVDLQTLMVYAAEIYSTKDIFSYDEAMGDRLDACRLAIKRSLYLQNPKLHVPGRVHHIVTVQTPDKRKYTVADTCSPERFCEVILKKSAFWHHMPDRYEKAFDNLYVTFLMQELDKRQTLETKTLQEKLEEFSTLNKQLESFTLNSSESLELSE